MGIPLPGGESRMQLLPMASSPDGLISARYAGTDQYPPPKGGVPFTSQPPCSPDAQ